MPQRHLVPVIVADYIPAKFKQPLFVLVSPYQDRKTGEIGFHAEVVGGPVHTEARTFNMAVIHAVGITWKRYLTLRISLPRLAPSLYDEYKRLDEVFEYHF